MWYYYHCSSELLGYFGPYGVPDDTTEECKLMDIFHSALEYLPKLWMRSFCFDEAIIAYWRALAKQTYMVESHSSPEVSNFQQKSPTGQISLTLYCLILTVLNVSTIGKRRRVHSSVLQLILMKFQARRLQTLTIFHIYRSGQEQHEICNMHGCILAFSHGFEHLVRT